MGNNRQFIRAQVAIDSMRDNGFLSAAHALAEIIDNSVQAGATCIDLIAFEARSVKADGSTSIRMVDQIGILDNGCGMDTETLYLALEFGASKNRDNENGIGKFGMGLPNASISQCKRVDVWSWKSLSEVHHTYLDIDEIKNGNLEDIPYPQKEGIPSDIVKCLGEKMPASGTFVLWSKIDRCQWKTATAIFRHTEDIVGRMYRYFLADDKVSIRFKTAEKNNSFYSVSNEYKFKPNDPLYLLKNTSLPDLPGAYKGESFFEIVDEHAFEIADHNGVRHLVHIKGSIVKRSILHAICRTTAATAGHTPWGKHTLKNMGMSVVRSGRELILSEEFFTTDMIQRGVGRWCGIELSFSPALDVTFGVTNNKQHAVNLKMMKVSDDYEQAGFESEREYRSDLLTNNDPKLRIYEVIDQILDVRQKLIKRIEGLSFAGTKPRDESIVATGPSTVESVILKVNELSENREDKHPTDDSQPSLEEVQQTLITAGSTKEAALETAKQIIENKLKVWIETTPMSTNAFFDVTTKKGFTLLQINENHVFTKKILMQVSPQQKEALEICLAGWARMEKESQSERLKEQLERIRKDWGQLLTDFLGDAEEW